MYYRLPNNIKINRETNEKIQSITLNKKDGDSEASEVDKTFFVFSFNSIGQEIEEIFSKHDFCWLGWSGFYMRDQTKNSN